MYQWNRRKTGGGLGLLVGMEYLKRVLVGFFGWLFVAVAVGVERPHIVLVMADDLGFSDLGCYGGEIETPTLDGLAQNGLRFSQFYNTAKCHSSRVSLLTGLYCTQAGDESLKRGVTLADVLGKAGYFTAMAGKWHLKDEPTDHGFERYFGHLSGATNFFTGDGTFRLNGEKWEVPAEGFYTTDANTEFAKGFVDEAAESGKPMFLYMAYNAPHYPLHAPEAEVMKYRGKYQKGWDELRKERHARQIAMGVVEEKWGLSPRPEHVKAWDELGAEEQDWEDFRMAAYAGMVDRLDQKLGDLVAHLKVRGMWENTLFLFCSDNGACPFERTRGKEFMPWDARSYWTYDTGWAHAGNTPFRWYKQNQHEGGISSPMIAHWPAGLKAEAGSITGEVGHLTDFMATFVELGGAEYPGEWDGRAVEPLQGKSLVPVLGGGGVLEREWLYFTFGNNRAIRQGDWKLVSARGGAWELYDLAADRCELKDLSGLEPERVEAMAKRWFRVAEEVDRLPARKRKPVGGKPAAWKN